MKLSWIIAGVSAGLLYYVIKNQPTSAYSTGYNDDVDDAASSVGNWGTKQRVSGTGSELGGKVQEGFGKLTGDKETEGKGVVNQAVGNVKNVAGKAANAVENAVKGK